MSKRITAYRLGTIGIASHMERRDRNSRSWLVWLLVLVAIALLLIALSFLAAPTVAHAEALPPPRTSGAGDDVVQREGREVSRIGVDAFARQEKANPIVPVLPETGADLTGATLIVSAAFAVLGLTVITLALQLMKSASSNCD